eukprot:4577447-Amphidinium_carterae.1
MLVGEGGCSGGPSHSVASLGKMGITHQVCGESVVCCRLSFLGIGVPHRFPKKRASSEPPKAPPKRFKEHTGL